MRIDLCNPWATLVPPGSPICVGNRHHCSHYRRNSWLYVIRNEVHMYFRTFISLYWLDVVPLSPFNAPCRSHISLFELAINHLLHFINHMGPIGILLQGWPLFYTQGWLPVYTWHSLVFLYRAHISCFMEQIQDHSYTHTTSGVLFPGY